MRFPLELVDEVKSVVEKYSKKPFIVGYRFSPEEEEETGITMDQTVKLIDALSDKGLTYLHISQVEFYTKPHRFSGDETKTRIEILVDTIHGRTPFIGIGSIYSLEDAEKASKSGIDLLALGRELLIEPDWVQKAETGEHITTKMDKSKQSELVIPDPMWKMLHRPGWIPGM